MERKAKDGIIHEANVLPLATSPAEAAEPPDLGASVEPVVESKLVPWRPWMRNPQIPM